MLSLLDTYSKPTFNSGCCLANGSFHQRCGCSGTVSLCKYFCTVDKHCKGYVGLTTGGCQLATTSPCPNSHQCTQFNKGFLGDLDEKQICGDQRYNGCFIKLTGTI